MSQDLGNMEELREAVIGFASEHISAVIEEVGGSSGGATIAAALGSAWTALQESKYEPLQTTAEELRLGCWKKLNGEGWPNVGWREAYIFGLIFLSLSLVRQHRMDPSSPTTRDILQAAMTHLDMSLIMGGASCEIVHTLIAIVEPALLRLSPPPPIDDADEDSWIVSSEPPPWAPVINPDLAIRREADLSPARSAAAAAAAPQQPACGRRARVRPLARARANLFCICARSRARARIHPRVMNARARSQVQEGVLQDGHARHHPRGDRQLACDAALAGPALLRARLRPPHRPRRGRPPPRRPQAGWRHRHDRQQPLPLPLPTASCHCHCQPPA